MTTQKDYLCNIRVLWYLKIPEILATLTLIIGGILYLVNATPFFISEYAFVIRVILIPIRLIFVSRKRSIEKTDPSLKNRYGTNAEKEMRRVINELEMIQVRNTMRIQGWAMRVEKWIKKPFGGK